MTLPTAACNGKRTLHPAVICSAFVLHPAQLAVALECQSICHRAMPEPTDFYIVAASRDECLFEFPDCLDHQGLMYCIL